MSKKRILVMLVVSVLALCAPLAFTGCSDKSEAASYVVTFDANGGNFADTGLNVAYETVKKGGSPKGEKTPERSNYEFVGWNQNKAATYAVSLSEISVAADMTLYAVWDDGATPPPPAQYTVTFYYNYTGSPTQKFKTEYVTENGKVAEPESPSRGTEWSFTGWYTQAEGGTPYEFSTAVTGNVDLYAHWEPAPVSYKAYFYYNYDGAPSELFMTKDVVDGTAVTKPEADPNRGKDWKFLGWYTQAEGGDPYVFSTLVKGEVKLYAHWDKIVADPVVTGIEITQKPTKKQYVVGQTFDKTGLVVTAVWDSGKRETLDEADYSLSKVETTAPGTKTVTVTYTPSGKAPLTSTFTVEVIARAVSALEWSGILENRTQEVGAKFDPTGLTFTAVWNDGARDQLDIADITFTSEVIGENGRFNAAHEGAEIEAVYGEGASAIACETKIVVTVVVPTAVKYDLAYDINNAVYESSVTGKPQATVANPVRVEEGSKITEPDDPALGGFAFGGWYKEAACTNAWDFDQDTVTANTTLYAKWTAIDYTLNYILLDGENSAQNPSAYSATAGEFKPFTLNNASKAHNTFDGWYLDSLYATKIETLTYATVTEEADAENALTLYAKFTPEHYTVSFEWGEAGYVSDYTAEFKSGVTAPDGYDYGANITLPDANNINITVIKAGEAVEFNFLGWYIKGDAKKEHVASIHASDFGNKTFVAHIVEAAVYNVTFDYNYTGAPTATVKKVVIGEKTSALSPDPVRAGYDFDKWYTTKGCDTPFDFANTAINGTTTVYANWTPKPYTVAYNNLPTGTVNTANSTSYTVESGANHDGVVTLAAPVSLPTGYRFFGWYSDSSLTQKVTTITSADIAKAVGGVITLYADCGNEYSVEFVENVASGEVSGMPQDDEKVYDSKITEPPADPTRASYTFGGWYKEAACTTAWNFAQDTVTADTKLYAKWIKNPVDGVYMYGTVGGKVLTVSDLSNYKATVSGTGDSAVYTLTGITLAAGDEFSLISYTESDGGKNRIVSASTVVAHPQAGLTVTAVSGGDYKVTECALTGAMWTITASKTKAEFVIRSNYIGLRAPDGTAATYTQVETADAKECYIVGNFTDDFKLYNEWSTKSTVLPLVKSGNKLVIENVHLEKYDEFAVVIGGAKLGGVYASLGAEIALSASAKHIMFGGETGSYNLVIDVETKTLKMYASPSSFQATVKTGAKFYVGFKPTASQFTVTNNGAPVTDVTVIADEAVEGKNTATIVCLGLGAFETVEYTAVVNAVTSVTVKTEPAKIEYYVGDALDFNDIVLTVTHEVGDPVEVSADSTELFERVTFTVADGFYADGKFAKADETVAVTIAYGEGSCTRNVKVYNKLTSIEIADPSETQYITGFAESGNTGVTGLDLAGLNVTAYYNGTTSKDGANAVSKVIAIKAGEDPGYVLSSSLNLNKAADYDVNVTYSETNGGLTADSKNKFVIKVIDPYIVEIEAQGSLNKATQFVGGAFDASGLTFKGKKNDKLNSSAGLSQDDVNKISYVVKVGDAIATSEAGIMIKSGAATVEAVYKDGDRTVNVKFGAATSIDFTVIDKLTSISSTEPTKKSYPQNSTFDRTGMVVTAKYNEGITGATVEEKTVTPESITADLSTVGEKTGVVTVTYTENGITETATVNVKVTAPKVVSVAVDSAALVKGEYYFGDRFDPNGLAFEATLDNGKTETLTADKFTFNGGNAFGAAGENVSVSVAYTDDSTVTVTADVKVTVYNKLTSIVVTTQPTAPHEQADGTKIWVTGDTAEYTDLVITAYYNGTTAADAASAVTVTVAPKTADANGYTTSAVDMSTAGDKEITVTYIENKIEKTVKFTIKVEPKTPVKISVKEGSTIPTQSMGATLKTAGIEFMVEYNNGSSDPIAASELVFTCTDFDNTGVFGMGETDGSTIKAYESTVNVALKSDTTKILGSFKVSVQFTGEYTISFVCLNGDYEVKKAPPEAGVKRGQPIPKPGDPTCKGFTFGGWYKSDDTAWQFDTDTVNGNMTLYGKWTPINYTVTFKQENDDLITSESFKATNGVFGTLNLMTVSAPAVANNNHVGWYIDGAADRVTIKVLDYTMLPETGKDITLKPVYELVKHTVTFNLNGATGTAPEELSVSHGGTATAPTAPSRDHYTFGGWYKEVGCTTEWKFDTDTVTADTTLYAKWTPVNYTVTYNLNGATGTAPEDETVAYGSTFSAPTTPEWTGHTFGGWYTTDKPGDGDTAYSFDATVTADITLYAKWTVTTYQVTFDSQGGSAVETQTVSYNGKATAPTAPTLKHYEFGGWYTTATPGESDTAYSFDTAVTAAVALHAKWTEYEYTVVYENCTAGNGGNPTTYVLSNGTVDLKDPVQPDSTHIFSHWEDIDKNKVTALTADLFDNTAGKTTVTLYAIFPARTSFTVTFDANGGENPPDEITVETGKTFTQPEKVPTKEHCTFGGWYKEKECKNAWVYGTDTVTTDITLYAKWNDITYSVTFDANGGKNAPAALTVKEGDKFTKPTTDPSREHYTFDGWYKESGCKNAWVYGTDTVGRNITLYAKWTPVNYTVTFNLNGATGTAPEAKTVAYGSTFSAPTEPEWTGHTFGGWYTKASPVEGDAAWDFDADTVSGDMTLYAKWTENKYTVTYYANRPVVGLANGNNIATPVVGVDETPVDITDKVVEPIDKPTLAGFTFGGWYTAATCTDAQKYTFGSAVTADVKLYAKWTENTTENSKAIGGLYVNNVYKAKLVDNGSTGTVVAFKVQHIVLSKNDVLTFRFNGKNIESKVSVRETKTVSGFTPGAIANGTANISLKVTTAGSFSLYYSSINDTDKDRFWVEPEPPYVESKLQATDGVYVDGKLVLKFAVDENSLNKVIAQGEINNADVNDHTMHSITIQYEGSPVANIILNVKSGITTDPAAAESGDATQVGSFKMYSGTYKFYYAYALSDDCAAKRLWIEGTQAGGPDVVIPEGAEAVGTDTVYLVGKFGESSVTYDYGYKMKEDSSTQHSITKELAVGDMFAGWHKGWNMWVAELENSMTGKLSEITVDGKKYLKVVTAGTYKLYCKHVSGGKNQFYVEYSSGGSDNPNAQFELVDATKTGVYLVGTFSDASWNTGFAFSTTDNNCYTITRVYLEKDWNIKVRYNGGWYGFDTIKAKYGESTAQKQGATEGTGQNIVINKTGYYTIEFYKEYDGAKLISITNYSAT